mmetsp:Transcript_27593/g.43691  ORF Transcript_27593/g.43691 Transcript_27593/m.43691 type:complete len:841 (+) Transcript_27593:65-2587(+)|eukprot:CAMPEP_0197034678 /NCGR_PEP_ID=MMETSP1384-20130603/12706_1 /TAXON_ID=29189 /ORGANISM="Ammonia sp." /LENGTH=840 /DNA_ID=CAMNT_0042464629 /DNA_START=61 /DNA_END=2583 /DNA_ORIENTATION=+
MEEQKSADVTKIRGGGRIYFDNNSVCVAATSSFPTFKVNYILPEKGGSFYYEVELLSSGLHQIGWATDKLSVSSNDGVGDDCNSWAVDGYRVIKWHGTRSPYGERWQAHDIIACGVDMQSKTFEFFRNGRSLGVAFEGANIDAPIYPAFTSRAGEALRIIPAKHFRFHKGDTLQKYQQAINVYVQDDNNIPVAALETPTKVVRRGWIGSDKKQLVHEVKVLNNNYIIEWNEDLITKKEFVEVLGEAITPRGFARYQRAVRKLDQSENSPSVQYQQQRTALGDAISTCQRRKQATMKKAILREYSYPKTRGWWGGTGSDKHIIVYDAEEVDAERMLQTLQTENARLHQTQQELAVQLKETEKMVESLQEQNAKLQKENLNLPPALKQIAELQQENQRLRLKLQQQQNESATLQQQLQRAYTVRAVEEMAASQALSLKEEVKQKQSDLQQMVDVHATRLQEWTMCNTKLAKCLQIDDSNDDDEKEQQEETDVLDAKQLVAAYTECMRMLQTQQSRSREIAEHVMQLSKPKKELRNISKQYATKQQTLQQESGALDATYTNLKSQREHLNGKISKMVTEMNAIIEKENTVNKQKYAKADVLNATKLEKEKFDALLEAYKSLTKQYKEFQDEVAKKAKETEAHFASKWIEHERRWPQWNVDEIICWIQYLMHAEKIKLSQDVNLENVAKEMESAKFTGKLLSKMEETHLKLFGVTNFQDIIQVFKAIQELIDKYPDVKDDDAKDMDDAYDDGVEGGVLETAQPAVDIPKQYLCRISNTMMVDPIIYDGVTYDRHNFMQYVQQHGVVPGTDEPFDEDEDIFENINLKEEIEAYLVSNPQCRQEGI